MTETVTMPTIRATALAGIVQELRQQGAGVDRLLHKHLGHASVFNDPYEQVPLAVFVGLLEDAAAELDEPALGVKLGGRSHPEEFGPIGLMFLAAPNLRIALGYVSTFFSVWQSRTRIELDVRGELPEFIYSVLDRSIWPRRHDAELTLAGTCSAIRAVLGARWNPVEVHLEHERPGQNIREIEAAFQRVYRAPVLWGQAVNRLILEPTDLVRPIAQRGTAMLPYLERHLKDLMRTQELAGPMAFDSCAAQVSHIISKRLGRADLDVPSIAAEIGLSPRTLQRRLTEEGTSFRDLVRRYRSEVVDRLLKDNNTKMTAIAHDVGYSDATTFSRAVKNWSGASPRDHRSTRSRR